MNKCNAFVGGILLLLMSVAVVAHAQYIPPTEVTGVTAMLSGAKQIVVTWTAPSNPGVTIAGYYVYRNGGQIATTPGVLSFTDTLQPGVYSYTVAAYDTNGNILPMSSASSQISVILDATPPTAPGNLTATATTSTITLSWGGSTDNVGVVGYYIYRNGSRINTSTISGTSYTDSSPLPQTLYTYTVQAYDASGNTSNNSNQVRIAAVFDETPPTLSPTFRVIASSSTEIDLAWSPAVDNIGVAGYYIYRDGTQIADIASSSVSYADIGLTPQSTHAYAIAAYDAAGNVSTHSATLNATTMMTDTIAPFTPTGLMAIKVAPTEVDLAWHPTTDNVGVAGYNVYRNWVQIGTTASTSYVDASLGTSTQYIYAIAAYDAANNVSLYDTIVVPIPATTTVTAATPVVPPPAAAAVSNPASVSVAPVTVAPPAVASSVSGIPAFTTMLYLGLRGSTIKDLQTVLIAQGDLDPAYATSFFGSLTQAAVQKFQCAQSIVCSGTPWSTGWGLVGAKTRKALNAVIAQ